MGFFDHFNNDDSVRNQVYGIDPNNQEHKAHLSHEVIGAAASYEAMRAYEQHCAANGQPTSHAEGKAILAGLAGAEVDRLFETKGLDMYDREQAKYQARYQAEQALQQSGQFGQF